MNLASIRPYNPNLDTRAVLPLWQAALGDTWPMRDDLLRRLLTDHRFYRGDDHLVAVADERIVGFVGTQVDRSGEDVQERSGGISVVLVHPERQRQGIGTRLHEAALGHLRQAGVGALRLGGGGAYRFWPGIPTDLPGAYPFFASCGWPLDPEQRSCDLVRDLSDYQMPAAMRARLAQEQVTIRPAREDEVADVLAFEAAHFPGWAGAFVYMAELGDFQNMLIAIDRTEGHRGHAHAAHADIPLAGGEHHVENAAGGQPRRHQRRGCGGERTGTRHRHRHGGSRLADTAGPWHRQLPH